MSARGKRPTRLSLRTAKVVDPENEEAKPRKKLTIKDEIRSVKRRKTPGRKTDEEKALERFVFGEVDGEPTPAFGEELSRFIRQTAILGAQADDEDEEAEGVKIESKPSVLGELSDEADSEDEAVSRKSEAAAPTERKAAWFDEDDASVRVAIAETPKLRKLRASGKERSLSGVEYTQRLRSKFAELNPSASWAELPQRRRRAEIKDGETDDDEEDDLALLRTTGSLTGKDSRLPSGSIAVTRMKDANLAEPAQAVVRRVQFHPNGQLMMTASLDKMIRFYQVDGVRNSKVQGVHFKDLPIRCAHFTNGGTEVVAAGRRRFFYSFDLHSGKATKVPGIKGRDEKSFESFVPSPDGQTLAFLGNNGYVVFVSAASKQWIGNVKMSGSVRSLAWAPDSGSLYSLGDEGHVYLWDVRTRKCINKHVDDGCINGTALAASTDGSYYATGSDSGVVNVYSTATRHEAVPKPLKAIMNLTTPIDHVAFNSDAQLLALASSHKKDAMRLVHLPSLTTFSNWPTSSTPLHYVSAIDFSPSSGYLAIGNDRGRVLLYRLNHFPGS